MKKSVDEDELISMSKVFLKKVFCAIPYVNTRFASPDEMEGRLGLTKFSANEDYTEEKDALYNTNEYRLKGRSMATGLYDYQDYEPSCLDPENKPEIEILISTDLKDDTNKLVGVLLHELCHYYCWYTGLENSDGSPQFERKLKELGIPSRNDVHYDKVLKKHVSTFDFESMEKYLSLYRKSL